MAVQNSEVVVRYIKHVFEQDLFLDHIFIILSLSRVHFTRISL